MLDLFSGLGGASRVFKARGWDVVRVELEERFNTLFDPAIVADVTTLDPTGLGKFDLVWASPPCQEFSKFGMPMFYPDPPEPSLECVNAVKRIVDILRPRFWVLENVRSAQRWLGPARQHAGSFYLWGDFPLMEDPPRCVKGIKHYHRGTYVRDAAKRAEIPLALSLAMCQAVEKELAPLC